MDCETARELLEARALEALDRHETRRVDEHLATCPDCRALYQRFEQAAMALPEALVAVAPESAPASLRDRVLKETRDGERHPRLFPRWSLLIRPQIAAAVAVILLGLSVAWAVHQSSALAKERSLRAELSEAIGQQELIFEVVDSARTTKAFLRATDPGSTSYGKLYTRPDLPYVVGLTGRLPKPGDAMVYNLWLTAQGRDFLAGPMSVTEKGFAVILYEAQSSGPTYEAARVILQPEGSAEPVGTTVLRWDAPK